VDSEVRVEEPADWSEGRDPRVERTRRLVLKAAIALLAESGYAGTTVEAVSARSGVAKSTIYRHWPNRLELINDAFQELKPPPPEPTEGDVRDRVVALLEHVARTVAASPWSSCLPALIDAAERDPECRELHNRMSRAGRQRLVDLLVGGQERGEIPADLDVEVMADALAGPIFMRRLMGDEPLDPAAVRHLVEQLLPRHHRSAAPSD
jgi:TetR/AcrR family transcriptional regulator, regulator of autoinduction and epiphytic fitness